MTRWTNSPDRRTDDRRKERLDVYPAILDRRQLSRRASDLQAEVDRLTAEVRTAIAVRTPR